MFLWAWNKLYLSTHVILWQCDLLSERCCIHRCPLTPLCAVFHIAAMVKGASVSVAMTVSAYLASMWGFSRSTSSVSWGKKKNAFLHFSKGSQKISLFEPLASSISDMKSVLLLFFFLLLPDVCAIRKTKKRERKCKIQSVWRADWTELCLRQVTYFTDVFISLKKDSRGSASCTFCTNEKVAAWPLLQLNDVIFPKISGGASYTKVRPIAWKILSCQVYSCDNHVQRSIEIF